jgi:hypothetical protein
MCNLRLSDLGHSRHRLPGHTHKPLTMWFRAMWYVTSQKSGGSALGLQRVLGLRSYQTVWAWLHKLRRAMVRPGRDRLTGWVEVDETYLGGLEEGGGRRQLGNKALIVVAAQADSKRIGRIRLRAIPDASAESLHSFVRTVSRRAAQSIQMAGPVRVRCSHRRRLPRTGATRLRSRGDGAAREAKGCQQAAPSGPSGGVVTETMAGGYAPRRRQPRALGLLSGRVHVPLQPPSIEKPRQTFLQTCRAGGSD